MFNSLRYSVKQAFVQVFRNRAMSIASMFSITAMLLILGLFFVIMVNIGVAIEEAKTEFDSVSAYLEDETTYDQVQTMILQLSGMPEVTEVYYLDKDTALEQWKAQEWQDNAYPPPLSAFPHGVGNKAAALCAALSPRLSGAL